MKQDIDSLSMTKTSHIHEDGVLVFGKRTNNRISFFDLWNTVRRIREEQYLRMTNPPILKISYRQFPNGKRTQRAFIHKPRVPPFAGVGYPPPQSPLRRLAPMHPSHSLCRQIGSELSCKNCSISRDDMNSIPPIKTLSNRI